MGSTALALSHMSTIYALVRLMETSLGVHSAWLPHTTATSALWVFLSTAADPWPGTKLISHQFSCLISVPRAVPDNEARKIIISKLTKEMSIMIKKLFKFQDVFVYFIVFKVNTVGFVFICFAANEFSKLREPSVFSLPRFCPHAEINFMQPAENEAKFQTLRIAAHFHRV
jgi:hypothetical protein